MIKIYNLERGVYDDYIGGTKRGKHCNEYMVKLKLSAMVNSTNVVTQWDNLKIYRIGTFSIVVKNCSPHTISLVYWTDRSYRISKEAKQKLQDTYVALGLSPDGQSYLNDISSIEEEGGDCNEESRED